MKDQWQIVADLKDPRTLKAVLNGHEFKINSVGLDCGLDCVEDGVMMTTSPDDRRVLKIEIPLSSSQIRFIESTGESS